MGGIVFLRHTAPSVPKHRGFYNEYLSIYLCRTRCGAVPCRCRGLLAERLAVKGGSRMQHHEYDPRAATITPEEAVKLAWFGTTAMTSKTVDALFRGILEQPLFDPVEGGAYAFLVNLVTLWNAGRVQGIREERARQRKKGGKR